MGAYLESGGLTTGSPAGCRPATRAASRRAQYERELGRADVRLFGAVPSDRAGAAGAWPHSRHRGTSSYDAMAVDTIAFLMALGGGPAHLLGWSDGGIVGLLAAMARPDLIRKLVVIGTNYDTTGVVPEAMEGFASLQADGDELANTQDAVRGGFPGRSRALAIGGCQVQGDNVTTEPMISVEQLGGITAHTLVVALAMMTLSPSITLRASSERSRTPSWL